ISDLQAQYGVRSPDDLDVRASNDRMGSASSLSLTGTSGGIEADITTTSDVDFYKFTTPLITLGISGIGIDVQTSDRSMLLSAVKVYDGSGRLITSSTASDPTNGDLVVQIPNIRPLSTYYVSVNAGSQDMFGVGSY